MASDDLRARIAEALMAWAETNNAPQYASMRRPATVVANANSRADAVMAVVRPELDRRDKRIEEYRESRRRWMEAAYADRRASSTVGEELRAALAALQAVREAQSLGEALAAVAKHDGLTRDPIPEPFSPPPGAAVCVICREWDRDFAKHTHCPSCGQPWNAEPTTKETLS